MHIITEVVLIDSQKNGAGAHGIVDIVRYIVTLSAPMGIPTGSMRPEMSLDSAHRSKSEPI